jgi:hypothetical protein
MFKLSDLLLVPVHKNDFAKLNEFAEASMIVKNPTKKDQIKALRRVILKEFEQFQEEQKWFNELENNMQNNLYHPKLIRRRSV